MKFNKLLIFFFVVVFASCSSDDTLPENNTDSEEETTEEPAEEPSDAPIDNPTDDPTIDSPNILLIIADDMGLDATPGYDVGTIKPQMPNLVQMMSEGITFNNLWSNPTCTPTRAALITGKYGFRTNVTEVGDELATSEISLQAFMSQNAAAYSSAVIGKWHLGDATTHPASMGVDYYAGITRGGVNSYTDWDFVTNGTTTTSTEYVTTTLTNTAISWVADQEQPWFLWLSYNAPHTPFHLPPNDLHNQGELAADQASIDANPLPYYMASLEAMDSEMGRFLDTMSEAERANTIIIFIGDNGTPNQVAQEYGNRRTKDRIYQGGVNVPMIVTGNGVNRSSESEDALITVTDIFATVSDIAGAGTTIINDSQSFKNLLSTTNTGTREFAYTEIGRDDNTSDLAIRNDTHKLLQFSDGSEEFYNLILDPFERSDLLANGLDVLSTADKLELENLTQELSRIQQ